MENVEFWQTFVSGCVSFVFYLIGLFKNRK